MKPIGTVLCLFLASCGSVDAPSCPSAMPAALTDGGIAEQAPRCHQSKQGDPQPFCVNSLGACYTMASDVDHTTVWGCWGMPPNGGTCIAVMVCD